MVLWEVAVDVVVECYEYVASLLPWWGWATLGLVVVTTVVLVR